MTQDQKNELLSQECHLFITNGLSKEATDLLFEAQLKKYLGVSKLHIQTNPKGKPYHKGDISFNRSHSGPFGVIAFSKAKSIGVDIEDAGRPLPVPAVQILERLFPDSLLENFGIYELDRRSENFRRLFFKLWTFHEAVVKTEGASVWSSPFIQNEHNWKSLNQKAVELSSGIFITDISEEGKFFGALGSTEPHLQLIRMSD